MFEISRELARTARAEFLRVLDQAAMAHELFQQELFDSDEERFIQREVERKLYEPQLPCGGNRERKMIERFKRLADRREWEWAWRAGLMARKFSETHGRYYKRNPLPTKGPDYKAVRDLLKESREERDRDKIWLAEQLLAGQPEPLSDFRLEPLFMVERPDGKMDRLIRLVNVRGETSKQVAMDSMSFHAPTKFRDYCLALGGFSWGGGEKDLQALHLDVNAMMAFKQVKQIVSFGWHALGRRPGPDGLIPGIWFYDDCALYNGKKIRPDEDGIYWVDVETAGSTSRPATNQRGFMIGELARDGKFLQGRPRMRPDLELNKVPSLQPNLSEQEAAKQLFSTLCLHLKANLGGYEGFLLVGSMLSYAAAPELYHRSDNFPGCWVHGVKGSGKTTIARVLVSMHGLRLTSGLDLISKQVTPIGLANALEQYSNILVWADEFRQHQITDDKLTMIRSGYDRTGAAKHNPLGLQREVNTNFLVSGETTTSDPATKSRYVHVQVAQSLRQGTEEEQRARLAWFNEHRDYYCLLMRYALQRRGEFVAHLLRSLKYWEESELVQTVEPRLRDVYGISYAAWCAFDALVEGFGGPTWIEFRTFLVGHSKGASVDVASEVSINVFLMDMITAYKEDAIDKKCFRVETVELPHPPGAPGQGRWYSHSLFIDPERVISAMKVYLARARGTVVLNRNDLRDQLSKTEFWIAETGGRKLRKRFDSNNGATTACWGFKIDHMPELGYNPISDEEVSRMLMEGADYRKGPIYAIVDDLLKSQRDEGPKL